MAINCIQRWCSFSRVLCAACEAHLAVVISQGDEAAASLGRAKLTLRAGLTQSADAAMVRVPRPLVELPFATALLPPARAEGAIWIGTVAVSYPFNIAATNVALSTSVAHLIVPSTLLS